MSMSRFTTLAAGGLALALVAAPLSAQVVNPGTNPRTPTTGPVTPTPSPTTGASVQDDLPFIREFASANLMEVRLGQLAKNRGANSAVKQFGERMMADHTQLENQLTTMVSNNGVSFTASLTPEHQQDISRLLGLNGQEFDRAYMTFMIQAHQNDIAKLQTQAQTARSVQVRDLVTASLPVLQQHLTMAQQVASQVGVQVAVTPTNPTPPVTNPNVPAPAPAPTAASQAGQSSRAEVAKDEEFIRDIAADNALEARLGQLAANRAQNSAVKQFAQQQDADHNRLQNEWIGMASSNGLAVQNGFGKNHKKKLDQLKKLSGRKFDREYMSMEIENHKDYINYLEKEGRASNSSQVRNLVERVLPVFMAHFREAKRIGAQVGADTDVTLRSERVSRK
jgi:putative membrane protein